MKHNHTSLSLSSCTEFFPFTFLPLNCTKSTEASEILCTVKYITEIRREDHMVFTGKPIQPKERLYKQTPLPAKSFCAAHIPFNNWSGHVPVSGSLSTALLFSCTPKSSLYFGFLKIIHIFAFHDNASLGCNLHTPKDTHWKYPISHSICHQVLLIHEWFLLQRRPLC